MGFFGASPLWFELLATASALILGGWIIKLIADNYAE